MYKVMLLFEGPDGWKTADTGYEADSLEKVDALRNDLLKWNPAFNFVVGAKEQGGERDD